MMVFVFALTACGGGSGTSTSSGTAPASSATTASVTTPAGDAFLGKWKLHGGPPHFQYENDLETSAVEFDQNGKGYWTSDYMAGYMTKKRVSARHQFQWSHIADDKIRIVLGSTAHDYAPSVQGDELTLTRSDPMAQIITIFDKAK